MRVGGQEGNGGSLLSINLLCGGPLVVPADHCFTTCNDITGKKHVKFTLAA